MIMNFGQFLLGISLIVNVFFIVSWLLYKSEMMEYKKQQALYKKNKKAKSFYSLKSGIKPKQPKFLWY